MQETYMQVKNSSLLTLIKNFAEAFDLFADNSGLNDYAYVSQELIRNASIRLPDLNIEIGRIGEIDEKGIVNIIKSWNFSRINPDKLFQLVLTLIKVLSKNNESGLKGAFSNDIVHSLNKLLLIIQDRKIIQAYSQASHKLTFFNPNRDHWFKKVGKSGIYQFDTAQDIYLINTIPAATSESHYISEIYNKPYTTTATASSLSVKIQSDTDRLMSYLYDLFMNVTTNTNHRVVFDAKIKVDNLFGGSRGWGFCNAGLAGTKTAWFSQQSDGNTNRFYTHTFNRELKVRELPILDEKWHHYKISLNPNSVEYFVDGVLVESVCNPNCIPDVPMRFHNCVDNVCFDIDKREKKYLQTTVAPRSNMMSDFWIYTV